MCRGAPLLLRLWFNQVAALWGDRIRLERGSVKISLTIVAHHPASSSAPVSSMLYSITEAAKQTGLGELTILRAIEDGRISSTKDLFGEWHVDEEDLHGLELATQEPALHPHIEDGAQKTQLAVTEPEPTASSQELVPALTGTTSGASSLTSAEHDSGEASLELQESRSIFIRLAKFEAGCRSGSTRDHEVRLDHRDKFPESMPNSCLWQIRSLPIKAILLLALGWVGGLSTYHFLDGSMAARDVKAWDQTPDAKARQISSADLARRSGSENGGRLADMPKPSGFDHAHRQLRAQRQAQPRSSSKAAADEGPTTTQSIAKQQDRVSTPPVAFPETRPSTISGWTLRGVVDGTAMLEGPYGTWKAARGDTVPGLGRVDSIVLWGNRWIVATSRGLVTTP